MKFGAYLRKARERQGMNQAALADKSGIPQTTISGIENDGKIPNFNNASKLADALGIDMNDFPKERVSK